MKFRLILILAALFAFASPAFAQTHPSQTAALAQAKADLQARGTDLASPCGAFAIVDLAAWRLRDTGAGLLSKPSGNNCQGYATDIIVYQDGSMYDVLVGGGETNGPAWQDVTAGNNASNAARWRPPVDTGFDTPQPPPQPQPDAPAAVTLEQLNAKLDAINAKLDALSAQVDTDTQKVQTQIGQVVKDAENSAKALLPFLGLLNMNKQ